MITFIRRNKPVPIKVLRDGEENRRVIIDIRAYTGDVNDFPMTNGTCFMEHHWGRPVALEANFESAIRAHEEARRLTALGYPATVLDSTDTWRSTLNAILEAEAKVSPRKPELRAL